MEKLLVYVLSCWLLSLLHAQPPAVRCFLPSSFGLPEHQEGAENQLHLPAENCRSIWQGGSWRRMAWWVPALSPQPECGQNTVLHQHLLACTGSLSAAAGQWRPEQPLKGCELVEIPPREWGSSVRCTKPRLWAAPVWCHENSSNSDHCVFGSISSLWSFLPVTGLENLSRNCELVPRKGGGRNLYLCEFLLLNALYISFATQQRIIISDTFIISVPEIPFLSSWKSQDVSKHTVILWHHPMVHFTSLQMSWSGGQFLAVALFTRSSKPGTVRELKAKFWE